MAELTKKAPRVIIAGGGTGGHLFPGIAVAEELLRSHPGAHITFVGTARGIEAEKVPALGYDLELIEVSGLKTVGLGGALKGLLRLPRALWQSFRLIGRLDPDVVIGVGGYASGPVVLMARLRGRATAILEQNSIPGLTNRILGRIVHTIFISFAMSRSFFPERKCQLSGNPIRRQIAASLADAANARESNRRPRLFVFGGSQGAKAVNELVVDAAAILRDRKIDLDIVHQTGKLTFEQTRAGYADKGMNVDVRAFIDDMATEYQRADLIVSRAGATTVAELGIVGKPAILIPFPFAADNHQELNAAELAESGAAVLARQSELTAEKLANLIAESLADPERRSRMESAMKGHGRPNAAAEVATWCAANAR